MNDLKLFKIRARQHDGEQYITCVIDVFANSADEAVKFVECDLKYRYCVIEYVTCYEIKKGIVNL